MVIPDKINIFVIFGIILFLSLVSAPLVDAKLSYEQEIKFVKSVEEVIGHISAAKENIKVGNSELASIHLTHPIAELYDDLHQGLKNNPQMDEKIELVLFILKNTNTAVSGEDFDESSSIILDMLNEAKSILISQETMNDSAFKFQVIEDLVKTAQQEYILGNNTDSESLGIVEFQDSDAFVKRAKNTMSTIEDIKLESKEECELYLEELSVLILNRQSNEDIIEKVDEITEEIKLIKETELKHRPSSIDLEENILSKESNIPTWIKVNADWWEDGLISDSEFLTGMQYLIEQNILTITFTQVSYFPSINEGIPEWIKNNAGWWADGLISDDEFLLGMQYLIEHGVLQV